MDIAVKLFRSVRGIFSERQRQAFEDTFLKVLRALPLKARISILYFKSFRRFPNFKNPKTFNEKCQWFKLNYDSRIPSCADKVTAKQIAAERIGADHVTPTLYSGDFLPPVEQRNWPIPYVIKASHGSGLNIFVRTETDKDWPHIGATLRTWLAYKFGYIGGEMFYGDFKPQILVEPFIGKFGEQPPDYKIFVFNGAPKYIQLDTDRATAHKRIMYDTEWNRLPFSFNYPNDPRDYAKPPQLAEMLDCAAKLGKGFGFMRADFYVIDGKVIFGEMSFAPDSGFARFDPPEMDRTMGDQWSVNQ